LVCVLISRTEWVSHVHITNPMSHLHITPCLTDLCVDMCVDMCWYICWYVYWYVSWYVRWYHELSWHTYEHTLDVAMPGDSTSQERIIIIWHIEHIISYHHHKTYKASTYRRDMKHRQPSKSWVNMFHHYITNSTSHVKTTNCMRRLRIDETWRWIDSHSRNESTCFVYISWTQ